MRRRVQVIGLTQGRAAAFRATVANVAAHGRDVAPCAAGFPGKTPRSAPSGGPSILGRRRRSRPSIQRWSEHVTECHNLAATGDVQLGQLAARSCVSFATKRR